MVFNTASDTGRHTNEHSLKVLCQVLLSRFENNQYIAFNAKDRNALKDELCRFLSSRMLTEQALTQRTRDAVSSKSEALEEQNITETEAFRMKKRDLKSSYEHQVSGFCLTKSLREVLADLVQFFFDCKLVEDVFESDEVLQKAARDIIQNFDETKVA